MEWEAYTQKKKKKHNHTFTYEPMSRAKESSFIGGDFEWDWIMCFFVGLWWVSKYRDIHSTCTAGHTKSGLDMMYSPRDCWRRVVIIRPLNGIMGGLIL